MNTESQIEAVLDQAMSLIKEAIRECITCPGMGYTWEARKHLFRARAAAKKSPNSQEVLDYLEAAIYNAKIALKAEGDAEKIKEAISCIEMAKGIAEGTIPNK